MRTERYKLIEFYTLGLWELYDLQTDPLELWSVYRDPAYQGVARQMKAELSRLRRQYRDDDEEPWRNVLGTRWDWTVGRGWLGGGDSED